MWILASHKRPHNVKRFFQNYLRTGGSTPGIVCIDETDPQIAEYKSLKFPKGWGLKVYPEMSMVDRVNTAFNEYPNKEWYGNIDDDSVPTTNGWDRRLVEAAGKNKVAHCYNGCSNEKLVCQHVTGGELARKIGWLLLPTTKRIFGDNAYTDMAKKLGEVVYLPDVRLEQYHFSNGKAPFDKTYEKPSALDDRKAYIKWYWENIETDKKPFGDELIICCVMNNNYADCGVEYVNNLYRSVQRNMTMPHRFVCFTDIPHGIQCETRPISGHGWFAKLFMFKEFTQGKVVFLDLDTVITGNMDFVNDYQGDFAILRDFYRPDGYGSGMMIWKGGFGHGITDAFVAEGQPDIPGGDQLYIESKVASADKLQEVYQDKIVSYKLHAENALPDKASIVCFHGFPRPHQVGGWVNDYWNDRIEVSMEMVANTVNVKDNILSACKRDIKRLDFAPANDKVCVLVGGGPSLKDTLAAIHYHVSQGATIIALNGSARFLNEEWIIPDIHIIIDAREENERFLQAESKEVYLASQCHPKLFDSAHDVTLFHMNTEGVSEYIPDENAHLISSGTTVGLAGMAIAYVLGYRVIHLHGYDSSYEDSHHAYIQPENDNDRVLEVVADNKKFKSAAWMVKQAQQFQELSPQLIEAGVTIIVSGSGLLPTIARRMVID